MKTFSDADTASSDCSTNEGTEVMMSEPCSGVPAPPPSDPLDFRRLYGLANGRRPGSARSLSSCTTTWSTSTDPASNTTRAKREKRKQRKRFRSFASLLMKFLERKDPTIFGLAQEVIRDCEERKNRGEAGFESVTDSLKEPLREVVGNVYWNAARRHQKRHSARSVCEPSVHQDQAPTFTSAEMSLLQHHWQYSDDTSCDDNSSAMSRNSNWMHLTTKSPQNPAQETELRRERFIMLLKLLLRYLKETDVVLFQKTQDCIEATLSSSQVDGTPESFDACSRRIRKDVKRLVGSRLWRSAENTLAKIIQQQDADEGMESLWNQPLHFDMPIHASDPSVLELSEASSAEFQQLFVNNCQVNPSKRSHKGDETSCGAEATAAASAAQVCSVAFLQSDITGFDRKRRRLHVSQ
eukprot:Nitzschia sp. Nitz4//scaffold6_size259037//125254//126483//NITZ4_001075-RA/size259037-processed-gene-0.264-mRNA-1//-1//CDS//3329556896//8254//frame0